MIPIVINNRNRLTTTEKLVKDLMWLGYDNIHIIDNGSTKYFSALRKIPQCYEEVHKFKINLFDDDNSILKNK